MYGESEITGAGLIIKGASPLSSGRTNLSVLGSIIGGPYLAGEGFEIERSFTNLYFE